MAELLLSKIEIGGQVYNLKDAYAREQIAQIIEDAKKHMVYTDIYANDVAVKAAIEAGDKAVKDYVDAQVGAINKFDVKVLTDGQALPTAGADTMYVLYLKPETDSASGAYVEWITIRSGEEGAYTYTWEAIGSTKMDVTGFVTSEALDDRLKLYVPRAQTIAGIDQQDAITKEELKAALAYGKLADKDSAEGTVAGQTISGVKATGKSTGSITVELEESEHAMNSTGKYTPVGNVKGNVVVASHDVPVALSHSTENATLTKGDYTPAGNITVTMAENNLNSITGVGTQASFTEGKFTPASIEKEDVTANYATAGLVGEVKDETLTFTAAAIAAITATKVNSFNGGSKEADSFTANSLPTYEAKTVGAEAAFTGTKAENLIVTGVSYSKATEGTGTCEGGTYDINASFTGTEGDINVAGKCHDYAVKTAAFNGADIELNVGDITVAAKDVTVQ